MKRKAHPTLCLYLRKTGPLKLHCHFLVLFLQQGQLQHKMFFVIQLKEEDTILEGG